MRLQVLSLLFAVMPCVAQDFDFKSSGFPEVEVTTLQEWDQLLKSVRESTWRAHADSESLGKDDRGRTLAQDLDEHTFKPSTIAKLDQLRKEADTQAGDSAALARTIAQAAELLKAEAYRCALFMGYWQMQPALRSQRELYQHVAEHAPPDAVATSAARIDAVKQKPGDALAESAELEGSYAQIDVAATMMIALMSQLSTYNDERVNLAALVAPEKLTADGKPMGRDRSTPCPLPVTQTSGGEKPKATSTISLADLYPAASIRAYLQGPVVVSTLVDASGCVKHVEIAKSSGSQALDDAALQWAESATYLPAEKDGKRIEAKMFTRVKFELKR